MSSIRMLRTLLAVAENGSFGAAAPKVGLTPAAVALQMRALEQNLNQVLFERVGRSVVLNTAGRRAVPAARDLVARYEELASRASTGFAGIVAIGAFVSALAGAFGLALWDLKRLHPRLEIKLVAGVSEELSSIVEGGELDIAATTKSPRRLSKGLRWTRLYSEPMVLIVPKRPQFQLADSVLRILESAPFLRFDRRTWTGQLVERVLDNTGCVPRDALELNYSVDAIASLVRQGFGVSIVPQSDPAWQRDPGLRVLVPPGEPVHRHVGLLERSGHSRRELTEAIKQKFR